MLDTYLHNGEGFLLVYSIIDEISFKKLPKLLNILHRVKEETPQPMVLCGNKVDLEKKRMVSFQEGSDFSKQFGSFFIETSARSRKNVIEAFLQLVREVRKFRALNPTPSRSSRRVGCQLL
eukprot:TRINITY_DN26172_c0_g1_i1.p1 TRINITY_DN26172_c0_g1~~TRINITY_DN26172_c0_g1_i1.p1  ORF type:complete len:121 (-),score=21.86 TRINITY_DN26172_c0_g1_i1:28-390(-)